MSYLALYRKYRPQIFEDVIGQEHITTSLINQMKNDSISHAYLFTGTRGTGKTSVAKIFARAINCEHPVNGSPCGECDICKELSKSNSMDILEIDAASNNKVDEIRELREKIKYPPVNGKYKVYIIDEVHMLTDSAFNALLKTLEEPPKYVVFILATTEVHKLPATILSRCMRFDFKLVSIADLEKLVKKIFTAEKIKYEDEAVAEIAKLGEGSVRDTLSIADMCVAYSNRNVTYESVLQGVGATSRDVLYNVAESVLSKSEKDVLENIHAVSVSGKNMNQFASDLTSYFRDLAVVKTTSNFADILKYPVDILNKLKGLADKVSIKELINCLNEISSLEQEFKYTANPRMLLEITLLNLCMGKEDKKPVEKPAVKDMAPARVENVADAQYIKEMKKTVIEMPEKKIFGKLSLALRENSEFVLQVVVGNVKNFELNGDVFTVYTDNELEFNTLNKKENVETLNKILNNIGGYRFNVVMRENSEKEKTPLNELKNKFNDILEIE